MQLSALEQPMAGHLLPDSGRCLGRQTAEETTTSHFLKQCTPPTSIGSHLDALKRQTLIHFWQRSLAAVCNKQQSSAQ